MNNLIYVLVFLNVWLYIICTSLYVKLYKHFNWDELMPSIIKMEWQSKDIKFNNTNLSFKNVERKDHACDGLCIVNMERDMDLEFKAWMLQFTTKWLSETRTLGCDASWYMGGSIAHTYHAERLVTHVYLYEFVSKLQKISLI